MGTEQGAGASGGCPGSVPSHDYATYDQRWCMTAGRWCKSACSQAWFCPARRDRPFEGKGTANAN